MRARQIHRIRRGVQVGVLLGLVLLPVFGILRIDVARGQFVVLGYQIWWSDFFIVYPFWIMVITLMAALYTALGMVFCGWGCPQNTLSEFAEAWIRRLVGRRATAGLGEMEQSVAPAGRERPRNWVWVVLLFAGVSAVLGGVVALYFLPAPLWKLEALPRGAFWVMGLVGALVFLDLLFIRHFWCKYVCPYGLYQYLFHHPWTLRVAFDESRSRECVGCNRCTESCFMGVEPRLLKEYTRCINCGDCVVACEEVAQRKGFQPLLRFTFERDEASTPEMRASWRFRLAWPLGIAAIAFCLFLYGVWTYPVAHLRVSTSPVLAASLGTMTNPMDGDYRIEIFNKTPHPQEWRLAVTGLPPSAVRLRPAQLTIPGGGEATARLWINPEALPDPMRPYPFQVQLFSPEADRPFLAQQVVYFHPGSN